MQWIGKAEAKYIYDSLCLGHISPSITRVVRGVNGVQWIGKAETKYIYDSLCLGYISPSITRDVCGVNGFQWIGKAKTKYIYDSLCWGHISPSITTDLCGLRGVQCIYRQGRNEVGRRPAPGGSSPRADHQPEVIQRFVQHDRNDLKGGDAHLVRHVELHLHLVARNMNCALVMGFSEARVIKTQLRVICTPQLTALCQNGAPKHYQVILPS